MNNINFLDMSSWDRAKHFMFFQSFADPHLNATTDFDITKLYLYRKKLVQAGIKAPSIMDCLYYMTLSSANKILEFKMRLVDKKPAVFDYVDCYFTHIPKGANIHVNCMGKFDENPVQFFKNLEHVKNLADLGEIGIDLEKNVAHPQAFVYLGATPGMNFSSLKTPMGDVWVDSVPRIIFSKVNRVVELNHITHIPETRYKVSVSLEALHSFIDGIHGQKFARSMLSFNNRPEKFLPKM